ncbi:MAG: hypothetical protein KDK39_19640, partial [Leptospiraceae bacterium]|nr:hypothetical protein [Leptospiraceae bacterium]
FWRRWHISLGQWFMQYLYIPLGGNRQWIYRNLLVTMLLCGLWHGAGWQFVLWGLFHGLWLAIERLTGLAKPVQNRAVRALRIGLTLHIVLFGWVIFRVSSMDNFDQIWHALLHNTSSHTSDWSVFVWVAIAWTGCFIPMAVFGRIRRIWLAVPAVVQGLIVSLFILLLFNLSIQDAKPFIYFQF